MTTNTNKGVKNLIPFKKGQSGNPKGAPKKTIAIVNIELEEQGYTAANAKDIVDCYMRLINLSLDDLTEKVKDNTQPAMIRIVGKAILSGKGFEVIEKMLDRGIGKAQQAIDLTTDGKPIFKIRIE